MQNTSGIHRIEPYPGVVRIRLGYIFAPVSWASTGSAVAAGASVVAPAVKKHYHWAPPEGKQVKGKPNAAWEKIAAAYSEFTLCPDRPGADTGERRAWNYRSRDDKTAVWERFCSLSLCDLGTTEWPPGCDRRLPGGAVSGLRCGEETTVSLARPGIAIVSSHTAMVSYSQGDCSLDLRRPS